MSGVQATRAAMSRYQCQICGHIYDPAEGDPTQGIAPGTSFEALPETWVCPECGSPKSTFEKM
jgi:rubredoxin